MVLRCHLLGICFHMCQIIALQGSEQSSRVQNEAFLFLTCHSHLSADLQKAGKDMGNVTPSWHHLA